MDRICTIIAMNYLPQAMCLLESTRKVYPNIEFFVLIIDSSTRNIEFLSTAKILLPEDLLIPSNWLSEMRSYYDAMELATSLKPFLLNTLLDDKTESVTYLDPDILVFDEVSEGMEVAKEFGIALTPHRLTPTKILGHNSLELSFLQYGVFNLGYIAVGHRSKQMLNWWGARLRWYCTKFPNNPAFTDQKWMNLIPALFEYKPILNPGYNLASWNLDERPLKIVDGKILTNTERVRFIHFAQISGMLAEGRYTGLWEQTLDKSQESINSLDLITSTSKEYSQKLVNCGSAIKQTRNSKTEISDVSYHTKKRLIAKSVALEMASGKVEKQISRPQSPKMWQDIGKFMEKSAMLNGFRDGLQIDLVKFDTFLRRKLRKQGT